MQFSPEAEQARWTDSSVVRGLMLGLLAVIAIGIWAVSLESLFVDQEAASIPWLVVRVFICEAVPLAALVALHRGVGTKLGIGAILSDALRSALFFLPRPAGKPPAALDEP